jgi:hypothetical protein
MIGFSMPVPRRIACPGGKGPHLPAFSFPHHLWTAPRPGVLHDVRAMPSPHPTPGARAPPCR